MSARLLPANQGMLEQGQRGDRGEVFGDRIGQREEQSAGGGLRERLPGAVVGLDPPAREVGRNARGERYGLA